MPNPDEMISNILTSSARFGERCNTTRVRGKEAGDIEHAVFTDDPAVRGGIVQSDVSGCVHCLRAALWAADHSNFFLGTALQLCSFTHSRSHGGGSGSGVVEASSG